MAKLLEVINIIKDYPSVRAVNNVSFSIEKGICFGLLGPNGAGKTTTVEIMEGITRPDSGEILYKNKPVSRQFKIEAGIQFQSTALQDFLTAREVLKLFESFYPKTIPIPELVTMCSLEDFVDQDNRKLSGGQRQRLYLALALINDPEIIFLDEPTTGLDPQARQNFWGLIKTIRSKSKTIILTTHNMEEANLLCDEILILDKGEIIAQGRPQDLLSEHFDKVWLVLPKNDFQPPADFPWKSVESGDNIEIQTDEITETLHTLIENGVVLSGLKIKRPSLEDLFLDLTGKDLRA